MREDDARSGLRAIMGRNPLLRTAYRVAVALVGTAIVLVGLALVPLPGPGWLIVFAGLALLGTEFAWAARLLTFARRHLTSWTMWIARRSAAGRVFVSVVALLAVAAVVWAYDVVVGLPSWLPVG